MVTPAVRAVVLVPLLCADLSQAKLRAAVALVLVGRGDWMLCQMISHPYGDTRSVLIDFYRQRAYGHR